jgi:hypothetical protein
MDLMRWWLALGIWLAGTGHGSTLLGQPHESRDLVSTERDRQVQLHLLPTTVAPVLDRVERQFAAGEHREGLDALQAILDRFPNHLIQAPASPLNPSFPMYHFLPIELHAAHLRQSWEESHPQAMAEYRATHEISIQSRWDSLRAEAPLDKLEALAVESTGCPLAAELWEWVGDVGLQRGWTQRARFAYYQADPRLRATWYGQDGAVQGWLPWHVVLRHRGPESPLPQALLAKSGDAKDDRLGGLWARMLACSIVDGDLQRARFERRVLAELFSDARVHPAQDSPRWLAVLDQWSKDRESSAKESSHAKCVTFAGGPDRSARSAIQPSALAEPSSQAQIDWSNPIWEQPLPRRLGDSDQTFVGGPRVAENREGLLAYHPLIHQGRVWIHDFRQIWAFELASGQSWPSSPNGNRHGSPVYKESMAEHQLIPLGYPVAGVPRATLSIVEQALYARSGSLVTAWRMKSSEGVDSRSWLVGLDLSAEGKLLPGFPVRLAGPEYANCEFDGTPLAIGDRLFVYATQRSSVHVRRFCLCLDRWNGRILWRSPFLASAMPADLENANEISHQLISFHQGRLFCSTGLGAIASLNAETGELVWLVQYPRVDIRQETYPRSLRFQHRDLAPPMVHHDMVICAPRDCREIIALDATTGDMIWATDPEQACDAVHLLGIDQDTLIVSGDHLYWIDLWSGQVRCRYPEAGIGLPGHASPSPRGLGRGLIVPSRIYWPVSRKVLVFATSVSRDRTGYAIPKLESTIDLGPRAAEGVHMTSDENHVVLTSPTRVMVYGRKK